MELDFTKATKQQLYAIAIDDKARLKDRYAAARELQNRRKKDAVCGDRPKY